MALNYNAIGEFEKLNAEVTTKPGQGWFGSKHLKVSAQINAPNLGARPGYEGLVQKSEKLEITDEGIDTPKNRKALARLVFTTVPDAYIARFRTTPIPRDSIGDDSNSEICEKLDDNDQQALRIHVEESMDGFADTFAKKLTETTGVTVGTPSRGRWFRDYDYFAAYETALHELNRKLREKRAGVERYRFNGFGDTQTIRDRRTNMTYALEFDGLRVYRDHFIYKTAHFTVYDVEARGKTKIGDLELMDRQWATDVTLPGTRINLDVEIGEGYVDLKVTER